jgi:hypothetical protein
MRQPPTDHQEDALGRDLRAAIDSLPTFTLPMPLRGTARRSVAGSVLRTTTMLAGSALVIILALVVGETIGERRTALTSTPPTDTAYGLIVQSGGPGVVREDNPTAPLAQLYQEPSHRGLSELGVVHAISPDGTRVAYWIWGPSPAGLGSLSLTRLALYDAAAGTTREVLSLPNGAGGGVVWSTDGTGLLVSVLARGVPPCPQPEDDRRTCAGATPGPSGAQLAQLRTIDLATGTVTSVGPMFGAQPASGGPFGATPRPTPAPDGQIGMKPLLWDRARDLIVAAVAAPNPNYASSIIAIDRGRESDELLAEGLFLTSTLAVSPDGKSIAGARTRDFALVAWPIGDYAKRNEIVPATGERILSLWWRPKTDELYFLHDNALATTDPAAMWSHLEVWRPGAGAARVVDATAGPGLLFRFDGSAYLMVRPGSTAQITYDVVDTNSGRVLGQITNVRIAGTLLLPRATRPIAVATPHVSLAPAATSISREQAIALVRSSRDIGRVDRVEAKLMSFEEYVQLAGRVQTHTGDPQAPAVAGFGITGDPAKRYVWVVAVSGEAWPSGRTPVYFGGPPPVPPTPYPPYRWAMFLVDAVPGQLMTIGDAGIGESWPAVFDRLPDHPATVSVPASPSPLASPLQVRILGPEAISAVLRMTAEVHRVDRIEVKLVTRGEFERAQPSGAASFDESAPVWVVAVAGDISPQFARGATFTSASFLVDANSGSIIGVTARAERWPAYFDALPNHGTP